MAYESNIAQSAVDFHGLNQLRQQAVKGSDAEQTLKQVAGQFESLFVNMMLKSMRQASLAEGMFDSTQSKMYQDMADQQLASDLSMRGGLGLQDAIIKQLGSYQLQSSQPARTDQSYSYDTVTIRPALAKKVNELMIKQIREIHAENGEIETKADLMNLGEKVFNSPKDFVQTLWPYAQQAADKIGVSPEVILSQAALETGWGKFVLKSKSGETSFNLFNIKADKSWDGERVSKVALEHRDGKAYNEASQFRAYDSYQDSFNDYVEFLQTQPRYRNALQHTNDAEAFVEHLHKAGFATDPQYADKIKRIMNSDILARISLESDHA